MTTLLRSARLPLLFCSKGSVASPFSTYTVKKRLARPRHAQMNILNVSQHQLNHLDDRLFAEMDASNMIFHVVDTAEDPPATDPLTQNARVVLCLVACTVFLAGEATLCRLRTALGSMAAEEVFTVAVEMFAQVASAPEHCLRRAPRVRTAPAPVAVGQSVV